MNALVEYLYLRLDLNLPVNLLLVLRCAQLAVLVFDALLIKLHFVEISLQCLQHPLRVGVGWRQLCDI